MNKALPPTVSLLTPAVDSDGTYDVTCSECGAIGSTLDQGRAWDMASAHAKYDHLTASVGGAPVPDAYAEFQAAEDARLIRDCAANGYVFPSVPCSECRGPVYFLPDEPGSQGSGHYAAHTCS